MIDAKAAVQTAVKYYRDITGDTTNQLSVEEVELVNEMGGLWRVTLGIPDRMSLMVGRQNKDFKVFEIRSGDGEVISMKIRNV